jgi:hypothetical protein
VKIGWLANIVEGGKWGSNYGAGSTMSSFLASKKRLRAFIQPNDENSEGRLLCFPSETTTATSLQMTNWATRQVTNYNTTGRICQANSSATNTDYNPFASFLSPPNIPFRKLFVSPFILIYRIPLNIHHR